jgi:Rad3-related DNA helicase
MWGEQLSCVIIDRLPFAVPSDPVVAARVKAIDADGGNAFFQYQVPAAVITLKQDRPVDLGRCMIAGYLRCWITVF